MRTFIADNFWNAETTTSEVDLCYMRSVSTVAKLHFVFYSQEGNVIGPQCIFNQILHYEVYQMEDHLVT